MTVEIGVDFDSDGSGAKWTVGIPNVSSAESHQVVSHIARLVKDKAHAVGTTIVVAHVDYEFQIKICPQVNEAVVPSCTSLAGAGCGQLNTVTAIEVGVAHRVPLCNPL